MCSVGINGPGTRLGVATRDGRRQSPTTLPTTRVFYQRTGAGASRQDDVCIMAAQYTLHQLGVPA